jgi:hypothetical protein
MKQTIAWHENGLKNRKQYYEQRVQAHKREKEEIDKTYNEIRIIEYQIESAKKEGKDGFDGEKYKRVKIAIPYGYYKRCFECNCFINYGNKSFMNNPKKCIEHKGLKFITQEEYEKERKQ